MSEVKFILGRSKTGKTHKILTEIKNKCADDPMGNPIFVITPEQMTFHMEYQLLLMNKTNSMVRANVVSFNRLAHRVMQEVGGLSQYHLDEVGKAMLLQKIMVENRNDLGIFANHVKKPGFIKKMDELFSEFKNYQLDTVNLGKKLHDTSMQPQAKQKILTLANIYEQFNEVTLSQYLTTEDYFARLIERIEKSDLIRHADIYIDGYHTFNVAEQAIIQKLAQHANSLTIVLTLCTKSSSSLWNMTRTTYKNLKDILEPFKPSIVRMSGLKHLLKPYEDLLYLEKNFMQGVVASTTEAANIHLLAAPSRLLEIEEVAVRIYQLAHDRGVAFSNIAVYSSNPQMDYRLYKTIFTKHGIPHFLDYKEDMMSHSVVQMLHKVIDIFALNWNHNAIFTALKTGVFVDVKNFVQGVSYEGAVAKHLEDIDLLENYALARNMKKHDWTSGEVWTYSKYNITNQTDAELEIQMQLNLVKQQVVLPLLEFGVKLENASTVIDFASAVFEFIEQLEIPKKLQLMTESANESGNQKEGKQHEQVWSKLLQILEQIVEVSGTDEMSSSEFTQLFKTGIEQLTFATVPPALDAVQIGDIVRSRHQLTPNFNKLDNYGIKHVFVIGVNDGVLPSIPAESSLLSEREREILVGLDIQLAPSLAQSQQDEIFSLYTILSTACESVTLSYTHENEGQPSYVFNHMKQLFPNIEVVDIDEDYSYERLTTKKALFGKTLLNLKLNSKSPDYCEPILKYYECSDHIKYQIIRRAIGYENQVESLPIELTKEVYGEEIEASVSRIELFNKCQFAHFMNYGLQLRERKKFELTMPDIGSLYHEALKYISLLIKKERRSFASLGADEIKKLAKLGVDETIKKYRAFEILESSKRMNVLKYKLTAVVEKTIIALVQQRTRSEFKESYFELKFGKRVNEGNVFGIETKARRMGDFNFSLKGVIDRIDTVRTGDKTYLRVVDYKSGKKELELDTVYYGLSLQLLTYLDVAIKGLGEKNQIAGALYFHVHHPYTRINEEILTLDTLELKLQDQQAADYQMTGYLPENNEVVMLSDKRLAEGVETKSDVVPITLKKDQTFAARGNKILSVDDFELLRTYTNNKIEAAVSEMTTGNLMINPSRHKASTACDWCAFKAVCKFDAAHNEHHQMPVMKPDEALVMIKEVLENE